MVYDMVVVADFMPQSSAICLYNMSIYARCTKHPCAVYTTQNAFNFANENTQKGREILATLRCFGDTLWCLLGAHSCIVNANLVMAVGNSFKLFFLVYEGGSFHKEATRVKIAQEEGEKYDRSRTNKR